MYGFINVFSIRRSESCVLVVCWFVCSWAMGGVEIWRHNPRTQRSLCSLWRSNPPITSLYLIVSQWYRRLKYSTNHIAVCHSSSHTTTLKFHPKCSWPIKSQDDSPSPNQIVDTPLPHLAELNGSTTLGVHTQTLPQSPTRTTILPTTHKHYYSTYNISLSRALK